jgi:hypothetical protein
MGEIYVSSRLPLSKQAHSFSFFTRACSLLELAVVLPIHLATVFSTSVFFRRVFPESVVSIALESIEYSDGKNPWIVVSCSSGFTFALNVSTSK